MHFFPSRVCCFWLFEIASGFARFKWIFSFDSETIFSGVGFCKSVRMVSCKGCAFELPNVAECGLEIDEVTKWTQNSVKIKEFTNVGCPVITKKIVCDLKTTPFILYNSLSYNSRWRQTNRCAWLCVVKWSIVSGSWWQKHQHEMRCKFEFFCCKNKNISKQKQKCMIGEK